ncbi:HDOD domain-containing protein [Pseudodesulfovibrio sp.]|nr:HDOD domain-containing protein [Pseudodesulfovibrio sp.]
MSDMYTCSGDQTESPFMVRQPIFTRDKSVWGYELVTSSLPAMVDGSQATCLADFVVTFRDSLAFMMGGLAEGQKLIVNIDRDNLSCEEIGQADWADCIFNVCRDAIDDPQCHEFVSFVNAAGGSISLESESRSKLGQELMEKSDFIRLSLADRTPREIMSIKRDFKDYSGQFLVGGVATWEDFEGTRALGFDYFQGPFFALPESRGKGKLGVGATAKLQLMNVLNDPDCQVDELTSIISKDVALSYNILQYINSASFGLKQEISSIQQAVSLLGLKDVRHWAMVVIMKGLDATPKGEELNFIALQRARFLSQLAESTPGFSHEPNILFMLGLFSKLDALLSCSMEVVLAEIPLNEGMKAGLCGQPNDFRDWVLLLNAIEIGNWGVANTIMGKHGVNFCEAAAHYMKASSWAAMVMPAVK